jgi:hypothetical protein
MTEEESNEHWLERQYKNDSSHEYVTNRLLAIIADRLTALSYHMSELNSNLYNINHNVAQTGKKK